MNCNIDMLGNIKLNLQLEFVDLENCKFTSSKQMEVFLKNLECSKDLNILRLDNLEFLQKSTVWSSSLANVVKACPLKLLTLSIDESSISNIRITAETLIKLFFALSQRKLEEIHISILNDLSNNTRKNDIVKMEEGFTKFLKYQTNLSYLGLDFNFHNIAPFQFIPEFIENNKEDIESY